MGDSDNDAHIKDYLTSELLSDTENNRLKNERKFCRLSSMATSQAIINGTSFVAYCLYKSFARIHHSCIPNVHIESTNRVELTGHLVAMQDISAGDVLCRSVIDNVGHDQQSRIEQLQQSYLCQRNTKCHCYRCKLEKIGIEQFLEHIQDNIDRNRIIKNLADLLIVEYNDLSIALYKVLLADDDSPELYYTIASALIELDRWNDAHYYFREGFSRYPHHADLKMMIQSLDAYESYNLDDDDDDVSKSLSTNHSESCHCITLVATAKNGKSKHVYISKEAVYDASECQFIIAAAEKYATTSSWTYQRHKAYPTSDIPIHAIPEVTKFFNESLKKKIFPLLADLYACKRIQIHDAFIVKYSAEDEKIQRYLPQHFDQSTHSLTIALNSHGDLLVHGDFRGGGILFESAISLCPKKGQLLAFTGKDIFHG